MLKIMLPYKKVKAIFCGHAHVYQFEQREHIHVIYQPAIGYNFSDNQPVGWLDAAFSNQGVDLTLHALAGKTDGDGQTTSLAWQA